MSLFVNPKLAAQSLKYRSAITQFNQLARKPVHSAEDIKAVAAAFQTNKQNLKLAASKRVEIAFNNFALREAVKGKVRSMSSQECEKWIKELLKYPQRVLEFPGARQAINEMQSERAQDAQSIITFIESVLEWSLKKSGDELKGNLQENTKNISNSLSFLGQTKNAATSKMLELKRKIESQGANSDKQKALDVAAVVVAVVLVAVAVITAVMTFGAAGAIFAVVVVVATATVTIIVDTAPAPEEVIQDTSSKVEECTNKAAERRSACQGLCPPGYPGNNCRALCEATFLADAAACLLL